MKRELAYSWGPRVEKDGTCFRLWAPAGERISLELEGGLIVPMSQNESGWWEILRAVPPHTLYRFRVGDVPVPDPASRAQKGDVHGWSVVTENSYHWRTPAWNGRPWEEAVIYELHAGICGGFRGVAARLDELANIGITAIELMPIADFPGKRNWGYDGVLPFAPDESYGTPDDLKFLIDEAHARGIMMLLDVVYNHFGPDGNYLSLYAPQFFREDHQTPWGGGIDFRHKEVRAFFIENALYWLCEFSFDGLRLDSVHAIKDDSFLEELSRTIATTFPQGRPIVLENDDNDAGLLKLFTAQWNDDLHHALHVILTGESAGYYGDFIEKPAEKLARALREGFVYQGEYSQNRGATRGSASAQLPPTAFISFLQNHDQAGNRAFGERLLELAKPEAIQAAAALVLLCPQIPMLFMGEEMGSRTPFLYFTDHLDPKLAAAVREGRRAEFAKFPAFSDEATREKIADPNAPETFADSVPKKGNGFWTGFYKELIALRREEIISRLKGARAKTAQALGENSVLAQWRMGDGARLTIASNLGAQPVHAALPDVAPLYGQAKSKSLPPFTTLAWIEAP